MHRRRVLNTLKWTWLASTQSVNIGLTLICAQNCQWHTCLYEYFKIPSASFFSTVIIGFTFICTQNRQWHNCLYEHFKNPSASFFSTWSSGYYYYYLINHYILWILMLLKYCYLQIYISLIGNKNRANTEFDSTDTAQCDEQNFKCDCRSRLICRLNNKTISKCKHCTRALLAPSLYYIQCTICGNIHKPCMPGTYQYRYVLNAWFCPISYAILPLHPLH